MTANPEIHGRTIEEWENLRSELGLNTDKLQPPSDSSYIMYDGHKIHECIVGLHNRLVDGFIPSITIDGPEQSGKSSLAMVIAHLLHHVLNDCAGDWTATNLLYSPQEMSDAMHEAVAQFLILDEAGRTINARHHSSKENETARGLQETQGFKKNPICTINPDISEVDSTVREKPYLHLEVKSPGVARPTIRKRKRSSPEEGVVYKTIRCDTWRYRRPPDRIKKEYRPKEIKFKSNLPEQYSTELEEKHKEQSSGSLADL